MVNVELTHCVASSACSPAAGCVCNCNGCMSARHNHVDVGGQQGYWVPYYPQPYNPYVVPYQPYIVGPVWCTTETTFNYNGGAIGIGSVN